MFLFQYLLLDFCDNREFSAESTTRWAAPQLTSCTTGASASRLRASRAHQRTMTANPARTAVSSTATTCDSRASHHGELLAGTHVRPVLLVSQACLVSRIPHRVCLSVCLSVCLRAVGHSRQASLTSVTSLSSLKDSTQGMSVRLSVCLSEGCGTLASGQSY